MIRKYLIALTVLIPCTVHAAVLCSTKNGTLRIRSDACKAKETHIDPAILGLVGPAGPAGERGLPGESVVAAETDVEARLSALESLTAAMSVDGDTVRFTGVNVQVVSGSGATDGPVNGVGNLIVGYNEQRPTDFNEDVSCTFGTPKLAIRTGSHNLILGRRHQYESYGSLLLGEWHTSEGHNSAAIGGHRCNFVGAGAVALSGGNNRAAQEAVTIGGKLNGVSDDPLGSGAAPRTIMIGGRDNSSVGEVTIGGSQSDTATGGAPHEPFNTAVWVAGEWFTNIPQ